MIKPPKHEDPASKVLHGRRPQKYTAKGLRFPSRNIKPHNRRSQHMLHEDKSFTEGRPVLHNRRT
jgi:hypothetical protein